MSLKKSQELKQLKSRSTKLTVECGELDKQVKKLQRKFNSTSNELSQLDKKIKNLESSSCGDLIVTEHAVIRYIERVMGIDLVQVTSQILTKDVEQMAKSLGSGKFPTGNGFRAIVKGNSIVSVTK